MRCVRALAAMTVAVALLAEAGCGGSNRATTPAAAPAKPALEQVYEKIGKDGQVSKQVALQAFTLTFGGHIPRVTVPAGPGVPTYVGGGALRWVTDRWSELDADQKAAVTTGLGFDPTRSATAAVTRGTAQLVAARAQLMSDSATVAAFQTQVAGAQQFIESHLSRAIPHPVSIVVEHQAPEGSPQMGAAMSVPPDRSECVLHAYPYGVAHLGDTAFIKGIVAHELFHCFQRAADFTPASSAAWVIEGQAAWVGASYGAQPGYTDIWWRWWLKKPELSLFADSYDAIGFYSHLAESGVDPWTVFDAMLAAGNKPAQALAASKATGATVADSLASASVRDPGLGTSWDTTGPGVTQDKAPRIESTIKDGTSSSDHVATTVRLIEDVDIQAETFVLDASFAAPHGLFRGADNKDRTMSSVNHEVYCTLQQCDCPKDSVLAGVSFTKVPPGHALLTMTPMAGDITFTESGHTLAEACGDTKAIDKCVVGTWTSSGILLDNGVVTYQGLAGATMQVSPTGATTLTLTGSAQLQYTYIDNGESGGGDAVSGVVTRKLATSGGRLEAGVVDTSAADETSIASDGGTSQLHGVVGTGLQGVFDVRDYAYQCTPTTMTWAGTQVTQYVYALTWEWQRTK